MNLVVSWYKRDVKKQRFQVRYWVVSNIFIFLYISREKFVEKFSKCCENGIACLRKGKLQWRRVLKNSCKILVKFQRSCTLDFQQLCASRSLNFFKLKVVSQS